MKTNLATLAKLGRLHNLTGFYLLLWPTIWALLICQTTPALTTIIPIINPQLYPNIIIFTIGSLLMRTAGCIINDIADRNIDPHVSRTKNRPLATKEFPIQWAIATAIILITLAATLALTTLNKHAFITCHLALGLALIYPYTKRWLACPQSILSLAFSISIIIVTLHTNSLFSPTILAILALTICWILIYDTIYARTDLNDDLQLPIGSSAKILGDKGSNYLTYALWIWIGTWLTLGLSNHWNITYFIILGLTAIPNIIYQTNMISSPNPEYNLKAFSANHYLGISITLAILMR